MSENELTIQELVDLSGVSRRNIHFYAQQGILPPPSGAGLSARYSQIHLLRLQAIPSLRERGLRLDEIRQRLSNLDEAGLTALLASEPHPPSPQILAAPDSQPPKTVFSAVNNHGHAFTHYVLPHGITLVVPAGLNDIDRHQVELLLASAVRILGGQPDNPGIHRNLC